MSEPIKLEVVTPERKVLEADVEAMVLPGADGFFGVLRNHEPLVALLGIGPLVYRSGGRKHRLAIAGGFFEMVANRATVLADAAETAEEIDVERARSALNRAEEQLRQSPGEREREALRAARDRALTRLKVAGRTSDRTG